jgi:hypothetical protein
MSEDVKNAANVVVSIGDNAIKQLIAETLEKPVNVLFSDIAPHGSIIIKDSASCDACATGTCTADHRRYMLQMQMVPRAYTLDLQQFLEVPVVNSMVKNMIDWTVSLYEPLKAHLANAGILFTHNVSIDIYGNIYLDETSDRRLGVCLFECNEQRTA